MSVLTPNCQILSRDVYPRDYNQQKWRNGQLLSLLNSSGFQLEQRNQQCRMIIDDSRRIRVHAFWAADVSKPTSVDLEPITDVDHLETLLQLAKEQSQPIIIDWMANWCRKCIYLKPKLEKLAAEYDTNDAGYEYPTHMRKPVNLTLDMFLTVNKSEFYRLYYCRTWVHLVKFYFVDVNKVPQALVKRGNISKMPTIQLWKDGEMKAEVIGGHKAWLVMEEVRQMIEDYV